MQIIPSVPVVAALDIALTSLVESLVLISLLLVLWALWEAKWVRRRDLTIYREVDEGEKRVHGRASLKSAHSGDCDELCIVQLTDFHFRGVGRRERRVARIVLAARPDLLLFTGDYVERTEDLAEWGAWVSELTKGIPSFAVLGNHDHRPTIDADALHHTLESAHIQLLSNDAEPLRVKGRQMILYGVDDPRLGFADFRRAWERGRRARQKMRAGRQRWHASQMQSDAISDHPGRPFQILLTHTSETATEAAEAGVDLILAGDTHGGQVRLPFIGPIAARTRYRTQGAEHVDGLYEVPAVQSGPSDGTSTTAHSSWLYVSRGIGTSHLPIRFACRPEVVVIRVKEAGQGRQR